MTFSVYKKIQPITYAVIYNVNIKLLKIKEVSFTKLSLVQGQKYGLLEPN